MRPLVVVDAAELVQPLLLALHGLLGRARRFGFKRAMHALVRAVLLGMTWDDAFDPDAEPDPPQRQRRKPCQAGRSEPATVVRQNGAWQTVLAENTLERAARVRPFATTVNG